jgi:two-component system cell cycle response regulator
MPGLIAGGLGLMAGGTGLVADTPTLGLVAGVLAMAAGLAAWQLAIRLDAHSAAQALIEDEVKALRASGAVGGPSTGGTDTTTGATGTAPDPSSDSSASSSPATTPSAASKSAPAPATDAAPGPTPRTATSADEAPTVADGLITIGGTGDQSTLIDSNTGLFSEEFFRVALESRIAAARRHLRPIAMVLLEVVEGLGASKPTPVGAELVAGTIKSTLREADTACRLRSGHFALLLEDTPENGAIWTVERIRRQLVEERDGLTVWAGVACYPAHAFGPDEIVRASEQALLSAREWHQDRIEVASASD